MPRGLACPPEISRGPHGSFVLIERDNRSGDFAELKTLVRRGLDAADDGLVGAAEKSGYEPFPELKATNGWITDKPEGVAITSDGRAFVVIDNDGVEDGSGGTWFLDHGRLGHLFRQLSWGDCCGASFSSGD